MTAGVQGTVVAASARVALEFGFGIELVVMSAVVLITQYAAFLFGLVMLFVVHEPRRRRALRSTVVVLALLHAAVLALTVYVSWIEPGDSYIVPALNFPVSFVGGIVLWRIMRRDLPPDGRRWPDE